MVLLSRLQFLNLDDCMSWLLIRPRRDTWWRQSNMMIHPDVNICNCYGSVNDIADNGIKRERKDDNNWIWRIMPMLIFAIAMKCKWHCWQWHVIGKEKVLRAYQLFCKNPADVSTISSPWPMEVIMVLLTMMILMMMWYNITLTIGVIMALLTMMMIMMMMIACRHIPTWQHITIIDNDDDEVGHRICWSTQIYKSLE